MERRLRFLAALFLITSSMHAFAQGDIRRGEYLSRAAGCMGCHTDQKPGSVPFAGGRAIATPFGTFYGPNITPHPDRGIGRWTEEDLKRAIKLGQRPDGNHYYPVFPYPSFTAMTDSDLADLWAYLRSLPASDRTNTNHDLKFPSGWRFVAGLWKRLFFTPGAPMVAASGNGAPVDGRIARGAYLVNVLGHCGECHTPRNVFGALTTNRWLAGGELPEGRTPNLTPTRLSRWKDPEVAEFLKSGATPEGDVPSEVMDEVIQNSTSKLTAADIAAIIAYLRSVPPQPEQKK